MKRLLIEIFKVIEGIMAALLTIGVSVIVILNLTYIYEYCIEKYQLLKYCGLTKNALMEDYNNLINYLQNPFKDKLVFNNFPMSVNGEFHFYEVKKIFLGIYLLVTIILVMFIIYAIYLKRKKGKIIFKEVVRILNNGANALVVILGTLLALILTNFSKSFVVFHKIFFNNNYWIFDYTTDPIINVLPEEVFKLYALCILALILVFICAYKILCFKYKKRASVSNNII